MTGVSGVLPSDMAGILHSCSWLHPHDRFDNFGGGIWKNSSSQKSSTSSWLSLGL